MSSSSDYVNYLNSLNNGFTYYCMWVILPTCVVGNLISLFIFSRPNLNKKTNTGFLYSWLCLLNILTLIYYSVVYRGNAMFKYTLYLPCGMDDYIRRTALNSITWIQVVICLDRFIAVVFPSRTAFMSKKIVLYGIMLVFLALILITNFTNLLTYPVTITFANTNFTYCYMSNNLSIATYLISVLMRVFIPFGIMLSLNLIVIWTLKQSKIRVGVSNVVQIASTSGHSRQFTNKEFRFTVSTLIIDFIFLFFYLPLGVNYGIATYNLFSTSLTSDPVWYAAFNLFSTLAQLLAMAHTSVLFIVFVIFNRNFRNELIVWLRLNRLFKSLQSENNTNMTRMVNNQSRI